MFGLNRCALVGMVHLLPLPGSPGHRGSMQAIVDRVGADCEALKDGGCDALIVENMGDVPYLKSGVAPETVAAMTVATIAAMAVGLPVGIQILAAANREALSVAAVTGASFIRAEGFAYAHVADEGWIDACAGELMRARSALGVDVAIWADVQKKHAAHTVTGDLSMEELARGHAFCGADVLVITGGETGASTALTDVQAAKQADLPVAVGSGVKPDDAAALSSEASALIVGSWLKQNGDWTRPVDAERVRALRTAMGV